MLMAIPLIALYEISIVVCRVSRRKREEDSDASEDVGEEGEG
jgi:Sec-independent protein secretion pathway component TatC